MAQNTRNYPKKSEDELKDTIKKLRNQVRSLKKANKDLKSENETLLDAWAKTESFLQEVTKGVPLEELIKHKKLPRKAGRKKKTEKKEDPREYWDRWRKEFIDNEKK